MSELVNYSTGVTVTSNWLNRAQLREEGLTGYIVYSAGGTIYCKALLPGGTDYTGTSLAGATNPIQQAINALASTGGKIFIRAGTYDFTTGQTPPAGLNLTPNAVGLIIPSNIILEGEGRNTILTSTTVIPGSPTVNDYIILLTNKNVSTADSFIGVRNLALTCPSPSQSATGLQAWDDGAIFWGAHDCIFQNVYTNNGNIQFYPNTANVNTATALSAGNNYNNTIENCLIQNETGSSAFFQASNCKLLHTKILTCWDDGFLIGSAGVDHLLLGNHIDCTAVVGGKGASSGCIRLQNDSVVDATNGMIGHKIIGNELINNTLTNGGSAHGLYMLLSKQIVIANCNIRNNSGSGIFTENSQKLTINGCVINNNLGTTGGIEIDATANATYYDFNISNNLIYNNQNHGININSNSASQNLQDVIIANNIALDDGTSTQTNGIRFGIAGTITNVLATGNNLIRSPTAIAIQGGSLTTSRFALNPGYNAQAASNVTAGASIWTYTNNDPYDEYMILNNLNGGSVSAISYRGDAGYPTTVNGFAFFLEPNQTIAVTWATTAPTFRKYPQ